LWVAGSKRVGGSLMGKNHCGKVRDIAFVRRAGNVVRPVKLSKRSKGFMGQQERMVTKNGEG